MKSMENLLLKTMLYQSLPGLLSEIRPYDALYNFILVHDR
jgi:hypothetical protein